MNSKKSSPDEIAAEEYAMGWPLEKRDLAEAFEQGLAHRDAEIAKLKQTLLQSGDCGHGKLQSDILDLQARCEIYEKGLNDFAKRVKILNCRCIDIQSLKQCDWCDLIDNELEALTTKGTTK